jgi:hypothetical protein
VLLVEAATERAAETAAAFLGPTILARHGATPHLVEKPCVFRVLYTLHADVQKT